MRPSLLILALLAILAACKPPAEPPAAAAVDANPAAAPAAESTAAAAAADAAVAVDAEPAPAPTQDSPIAFQSELEFIKDVYTLRTHGEGSGQNLLVLSAKRDGQPLGTPVEQLLDSTVATAFASDLNGDQSAEILVFTRSGGFAGFAFNADHFTPMSLPTLDGAQAEGYTGGDQFSIEGSKLVRRFTLDGGGTRTLTYTLGPAYAFVLESSADG
jgi:hypothetical protein